MKKLLLFVLLVSLFAGCKKNKDKTCSKDMAGFSGSHKITAATYKASPSAPEEDFYNQIYPDPCQRDDVITLNANGTATYTDAGVACVPAGDDSGTWSVSGSTLIIDGDAFNIQSFNCSTFVILFTDLPASEEQIKYTFTRQ